MNIVNYPRVTSKYGEKRTYTTTKGERKSDVHNGLDIVSGKNDDNLYAIYDGKVIYAKQDYTGCNTIVTAHHGVLLGGVLLVQYSHCSEFKKKVNDVVKAGDVVALMGATGNVTGKHLHVTMLNVPDNSWLNIATGKYIDSNKYYQWRDAFIFDPNKILRLY